MPRSGLFALCCGVALVLIAWPPAKADPHHCREAAERYHATHRDVRDALRRYAGCIEGSDGQDDCASEFSALRSAQEDFESAVSDNQSDCP